MINVAVVWLVMFTILVGWGLAIIWLLRRFGGTLSVFQTMWLGYAGLLCFLQVASLVVAVNDLVLGISLVPAAAGYALNRHAVVRRLRVLRARPRVTATVAVVILLAVIVVDYVACDLVRWYDTGLYHLQAVKWNAHYGTVRGLANLHTRLGYNNSLYVFAAWVDAFWEGMAAHVTDSFILAAALAQWFVEIFTSRTPRGRVRQVYCLATLPFLLTKLWTLEPSSLSTDLAVGVFAALLVLELLSLPLAANALTLAFIVALGATAVTTKLGGLALFAVCGALVLWLTRHGTWRERLSLFTLPLLLVIGWLVRGVIQSGWLLYPVFGRLPVRWAVPQDIADVDLGNIKSWSRVWGQGPEEVFGHGFWHWFSTWLDNFRMSHEFILLVIACALLAWRMASGPARSAVRRAGEWTAVAACVLGIAQWFLGAPDLRYGGFLFWLLPAALLAPMVATAMSDPTQRLKMVGLSLLLCVWGGGFAFRVNARVPKLWGRPPAPQTVEVQHTPLGPGILLRVPVSGDQCFDTALPCSPQGSWVLRTPSSLADGFFPSPKT
jgi:hypothetical protein